VAFDWIWNALSALAAVGTLVFTAALVRVSRRQADISHRQAEIAAKQADIQQAQHDLQVQQDKARKPVLEVHNVTVARWENDVLWFNAEIANLGGTQVTPNAVLLKWKTPDGRKEGWFGRILYRSPQEMGNLLSAGDIATFVCTIQFKTRPNTTETLWLQALAVDGSQSMETPFRLP
jgi:hypothetical protein